MCILAGAKVLTCHADKHPRDPDRDFTLKISIKHQNNSAHRSEMIQDHVTGLKTKSYPDHDIQAA